jgi:phage tail sheath protein FI
VPVAGTYDLEDGTDVEGSNIGAIESAYGDVDQIQIDFICAHNVPNNQVTNVVQIAENRMDCVVVASPDQAPFSAQHVVDWAVTKPSSSYLIMDGNWVQVYNKYEDKYEMIPACSSTAGIMAASDLDSAPWFSPAGTRRGQYFGVSALSFNPTKSDRNAMYEARVNPIVSMPGQGTVLFGDKTALSRPSAFDRINVRRLFLVIERAIGEAAKQVLFELNDDFTRAEFTNIVEPFLREIQGRRGITDFRVVCDDTNNTPQIIDQNQFIASVFIKPARSINYVTLNFVAVRTGVEFEEVVGTV